MRFIQAVFTFLFFLFLSLIASPAVLAAADFDTQVDIAYAFDNTLSARVVHRVELTNNLSHIYPTSYTLSITSGTLTNINVTVNGSAVTPQIDHTATTTSVTIPINSPHIGQYQKNLIQLSYNSSDFAEKLGGTIAITLPKTNKGNETTGFIRTVSLPKSFPDLSYSTITPQNVEDNGQGIRTYRFSGAGEQSLTLQFGQHASYQLSLSYVLKNTTSLPATSEIAIPPDTSYQSVYLTSINPKPKEIVLDSDGNWLARYDLSPQSKLGVETTLQVTVASSPQFFDPSTSTPTQASKYWEQTGQIKRLAAQLKNPQNLYDYLVQNLFYNYDLIDSRQRLGADQALSHPTQAICTEFSDSFVALSRSMGIPARELIGYTVGAQSTLKPSLSDQDILHAYTEYLDSSSHTWIAVDPTWGQTTGGTDYFHRLDFGHITFVRLGEDSSYPLPAGSYQGDAQSKQISVVEALSDAPQEEPTFDISNHDNHSYLTNTGHRAIINRHLFVNGHDVFVPYLTPFGTIQLPDSNDAISKFQLSSQTLITLGIGLVIFFTVIIFIIIHTKRRRMVK